MKLNRSIVSLQYKSYKNRIKHVITYQSKQSSFHDDINKTSNLKNIKYCNYT